MGFGFGFGFGGGGEDEFVDLVDSLLDMIELIQNVDGKVFHWKGFGIVGGGDRCIAFDMGEEVVDFFDGFEEHGGDGLFGMLGEGVFDELCHAYLNGGLTSSMDVGDLSNVATKLLDVGH